jgi:hypothetical protein
VAEYHTWKAALVFHGTRWFAVNGRRHMGPLEERRDRRNTNILLDDNYRAERLRC